MRSPLQGVWVRLPDPDLTLRRIGIEWTWESGEGRYSGPVLVEFPVSLLEEDGVEIFLIDGAGTLRGHGPALVDMSWSQWRLTGAFRQTEPWPIIK